MNKKIILISSITILATAGLILFLVLPKNTINEEEIIELKDKYIAIKSGLNLRSNPDKSSAVVTLIPFGAKVTIEKSEGDEIFLDERYGKWVNVKYDNKTGWIFSGFLCDFKPDTIIKPVADFYRDKYNKDENFSKFKGYANFKDSEVIIENIIDNYILLEIPTLTIDNISLSKGHVVWRYDVKQKNFFEACNAGDERTIYFLFLDKDRYLDLVVEYGYSAGKSLEVFLGSENGFVKSYELDSCWMNYYYLNLGSCGDMKFEYHDIVYTENKIKMGNTEVDMGDNIEIMYHYRFDCDKRKVEKYAESKIIESEGIITSIDLKNLSLVINDKENLKDTSFKFSDQLYTDEYYKKKIKDLKKGDEVSFSYETIEGEKILLAISIPIYTNRSSKITVIGMDYSKNLLAAKYENGSKHIYNLSEDIEFRGTIKNINDIKVNEEIGLSFTRNKLTAIESKDVMIITGIVEKLNKEERSIVIKSDLGETLHFEIIELAVITGYSKISDLSEINDDTVQIGLTGYTEISNISEINEGAKVTVKHPKSRDKIYYINVSDNAPK